MFNAQAFLEVLKRRFDDDLIDRLNYYYTPILICVFAILIGGKQYFGSPLQCWVPPQFTKSWEAYTEYQCFVQNTYFVPIQEDIPEEYWERDWREISYYQWVPFALAIQALLFFMPILMWRTFNWHSGIRVKQIMDAAVNVDNMEMGKREENVTKLADYLQQVLDTQRELKPTLRSLVFRFCGKRYGSYVTSLYIFVKILFIINVVCQFLIMNAFLGPRYTFWGFDVLRDISNGRPWEESGHFPRVTMCDVMVRGDSANIQRYTVQCVLLLNMLNEKIYIFLWWWFFVVAILNCINFLHWLVVSIPPIMRRAFVRRYLLVCPETASQMDNGRLRKFVHTNLRPDGVLLIRLIAGNGGELIATELVQEMWKMYSQRIAPPTIQPT